MSGLTLYTNPMSRGRIARWMLEEVGAPYEVVLVSFGEEMRSRAYRGVNPMGKVPALRHGETVVTETGAICAYLADMFPEAGLAPPERSPDRGPYYRWLFFGAGPFEAAVTNASFGVVTDTPELRSRAGYGSLADVLDTLESVLQAGEFLAGDRVSAADIYLGAQLGWAMSFGIVAERTTFRAYWERLSARPGYRRATEADDALMPPPAGPG